MLILRVLIGVYFAIPKLKAKLGRPYYQFVAERRRPPPVLFKLRALKPDQGLPSRLGTSLLVSRRDAKPRSESESDSDLKFQI